VIYHCSKNFQEGEVGWSTRTAGTLPNHTGTIPSKSSWSRFEKCTTSFDVSLPTPLLELDFKCNNTAFKCKISCRRLRALGLVLAAALGRPGHFLLDKNQKHADVAFVSDGSSGAPWRPRA
jgi:hypothetical protein